MVILFKNELLSVIKISLKKIIESIIQINSNNNKNKKKIKAIVNKIQNKKK